MFIYRRPADGKRCEIGLGGAITVPLARAIEKAAAVRVCVHDGRDPLVEKNIQDQIPTFGELADRHIATMGPSWRNPKHRAQWEMTLREYAKPLRGQFLGMNRRGAGST